MEKDQITLKELILKLQSGCIYLLKKKILIVLISLLGAFIGICYATFYTETLYSSKITFTIENKGNSGGLGDIATMVGLGEVGSGTNGMFGGENILFLIKSNRIIHESLKETVPELEEGNLLNVYLKTHYSKLIDSKNIQYYPLKLDTLKFTRKQDSLLQLVTKQIRENQLVTDRIDKKTNIIYVNVSDKNERWAYLFSKMLISNSIDLYMDLKVGKLVETEKALIRKKDSVRGLLDGTISTLAIEADLNNHIPLLRYKTNQSKKQIDVEMLTAIYGDIIKNLEITRFTKSQEEPIIEIIDEPLMPLEKSKFGKSKGAVLGGITAFLLITIYLIGNKILRGMLQN